MDGSLEPYKAPLKTVLKASSNRDRFMIGLNASLVIVYIGLALGSAWIFWLPAVAWLIASWFNISLMIQQYELDYVLNGQLDAQLDAQYATAHSDNPQFRILT